MDRLIFASNWMMNLQLHIVSVWLNSASLVLRYEISKKGCNANLQDPPKFRSESLVLITRGDREDLNYSKSVSYMTIYQSNQKIIQIWYSYWFSSVFQITKISNFSKMWRVMKNQNHRYESENWYFWPCQMEKFWDILTFPKIFFWHHIYSTRF